MVVIDPSKEVDTPMEEDEKQQIPPRIEPAASNNTVVEGSNRNDYIDVRMNPKVVDILLLDNRGKLNIFRALSPARVLVTLMWKPCLTTCYSLR